MPIHPTLYKLLQLFSITLRSVIWILLLLAVFRADPNNYSFIVKVFYHHNVIFLESIPHFNIIFEVCDVNGNREVAKGTAILKATK